MNSDGFIETADIRARFARAMSEMYQTEVPQYGTLISLVDAINEQVLAEQPELKASLVAAGELERLSVERHGAIRVGTAEELGVLRRLFAVMGMQPVGYYDLSVAGVPVHSTAFRPVEKRELDRNPFRLFTSLLRLDLIQDDDLRRRATDILSARDIFTPGVRDMIDRYETQGGLTDAEATRFVTEALETFRWHHDATVDYKTYQALHEEHPLIADIVCFRGPHINHLTPRTLDIDRAQAAMPEYDITPKKIIEGPPKRSRDILLRQTSFKALEESIRFAGDSTGHHTARFGEIEQRGIALTPAGRKLYDELLIRASEAKQGQDNAQYQQALSQVFADFPDDDATLRQKGLAFYQYTDTGHPVPGGTRPDDVEALLAAGCLRADPIVYEDFLPVSAAGIFRSNLGDESEQHNAGNARKQLLTEALGVEPADEMALYANISNRSLQRALDTIKQRISA